MRRICVLGGRVERRSGGVSRDATQMTIRGQPAPLETRSMPFRVTLYRDARLSTSNFVAWSD